MLGVLVGLGGDGAVDPDTTVLQVHPRLVGLLHSQLALCREGEGREEGKEKTVIPLGAGICVRWRQVHNAISVS